MTSWQVAITTTPGHQLDDAKLGQLTQALPGAALTYNNATGSVAVRFGLTARTQAQAVRDASRVLTGAARDVLGEVVPFTGIRIARGDKDPAPVVPELAGYIEIAAILGQARGKPMSRQRAREIAETHPDFPAPIARLSMGPVFTLEGVLAFAATWENKPGRPRISA